MLTQSEIALIKATVPILKEHGVTLTKYFYERMFKHNPELKNVFNMGNQHKGQQQTALALAVLAYAENIENPSVLLPVLERIGDRHTSLQILPEQYTIVGHHLLSSIKEVLGDGATDELIAAWAKAYQQLADIMIHLEKSIYMQKATLANGWEGWRKFIIKDKIHESDEITSFYLYPDDNKAVSLHKPGQYLTLKIFVESLGIFQPRQYSISSAPNNAYYRISVKKEINPGNGHKGILSNHLHEKMNINDLVDVTAPSGDFTFKTEGTAPLVLLSGGVGQTPFVSILEHLTQSQHNRKVNWVHACRSENVHAFKEQVAAWDQSLDWFDHISFYEQGHTDGNKTKSGRLNIEQVKEQVILPEAEYYLCGPKPFIEKAYADLRAHGIEKNQIFFEEFGPQTVQLN